MMMNDGGRRHGGDGWRQEAAVAMGFARNPNLLSNPFSHVNFVCSKSDNANNGLAIIYRVRGGPGFYLIDLIGPSTIKSTGPLPLKSPTVIFSYLPQVTKI